MSRKDWIRRRRTLAFTAIGVFFVGSALGMARADPADPYMPDSVRATYERARAEQQKALEEARKAAEQALREARAEAEVRRAARYQALRRIRYRQRKEEQAERDALAAETDPAKRRRLAAESRRQDLVRLAERMLGEREPATADLSLSLALNEAGAVRYGFADMVGRFTAPADTNTDTNTGANTDANLTGANLDVGDNAPSKDPLEAVDRDRAALQAALQPFVDWLEILQTRSFPASYLRIRAIVDPHRTGACPQPVVVVEGGRDWWTTWPCHNGTSTKRDGLKAQGLVRLAPEGPGDGVKPVLASVTLSDPVTGRSKTLSVAPDLPPFPEAEELRLMLADD